MVLGCRVEAELGRGAMGVVLRARAPNGQPVALKVVLDADAQPKRRERFVREARALAGLDHPHIVRLLRADLVGPAPCIVMELVEGADLEAVLAAEDRSRDELLGLLEQAARAVHHAHERGIVHRDLKPSNILVTPAGEAKVGDFGLVRDLDRRTRLTRTGAMLGTPSYMSPEQVRGDRDVGPPSDVFSLGVVLYEVLTGRRPFTGESALSLISSIVHDRPTPPSSLRRDLGPRHDALCARALAKRPAERPSALELAEGIARLRRDGGGRRWARPLRPVLAVAGLAAVACALGLVALRWPRTLPSAEVRRRAQRLAERADALLRSEASLAGALREAEALAAEVERLRAAAAPEDRRLLVGASERVRTLTGLATLSAGRRAQAQTAAEALATAGARGGEVLAAAIAVTASPVEPAAATAGARTLGRAIAGGWRACELRAWRARALGEAGLRARHDARLALADLEAVARRRPLRPGEQRLRVRALLALGQQAAAEEALAALPDPPLELRWAVALRFAGAAHAEHPREALERLRALPPQVDPAPERAKLARAVYALARSRAASLERQAEPNPEACFDLVDRCRLARLLSPAEPPPPDLIQTLLRAALGNFERGGPGRVGDPKLGRALSELVPDDHAVQRRLAGMVEFVTDHEGRRALLVPVRRAIALAADPTERVELQTVLCVTLAALNDRFEWAYDPAECRELVAVASELLSTLAPGPKQGIAYGARAVGLRRLGRLEEAWKDLGRAVEALPTLPQLRYTRMQVARALGKTEEAILDAAYHLDRLAEASQRTNQCVVFLWEQVGRERPAFVRPRLEAFLRSRPEYAGWWVRAALLQLLGGDAAAAGRSLAHAVHWLEEPASQAYARLRPTHLAAFRAARDAVAARGVAALEEVARLVEDLEDLRRRSEAKPGTLPHLP